MNHVWVGYSSVNLALGVCWAANNTRRKHGLRLYKKTDRFSHNEIASTPVKSYDKVVYLLLLYVILTPSILYLPGVSIRATTKLEKLFFRILSRLQKIVYYDDGLAGFIDNTYAWDCTRKVIPSATGGITWNQSNPAIIFFKAERVNIACLSSIQHGVSKTCFKRGANYSICIESNAADGSYLCSEYLESLKGERFGFYLRHPRITISSKFDTIRTVREDRSLNDTIITGDKCILIESLLISILELSSEVSIYTGCSSTVLLLILYAEKCNLLSRLKVFCAPQYNDVEPFNLPECKQFYQYLLLNYPRNVSFLKLP